MEDYYSILGIDKNATKEEVKKAYYKLIRKYTPEKNPDEFEKIRKAYEILIDDESREAYDMENKYGNEINEYLDKAQDALESGDFKTAIKYYKKVLIIYPSLDSVRNQLALALAYDNQISESLKQFNKLIEKNPDESLYLSNIANVYLKSEDFKMAEKYFIKAYKLEPTNVKYIIDVEHIYMETDRKERAIEFIESCIKSNQNDEELVILCYFRLLRLYIIADKYDKIDKVIIEFKNLIKNQQNKLFIANKFKELCFELHNAKLYSEICLVLKDIVSLLDDEDLEEMYKDSCSIDEIFSLYLKMREDKRIIGPLIGPIHYFIYGSEMDEDEFEDAVQENLDAIDSYLTYEASQYVIESINIIKKEYSKLYECRKELYDDIYKIASEKDIIYKKFEELTNDNSVCEPLKKIIALWLSDDLSEEERENYFSIATSEMGYESPQTVYNSVNNIKNKYWVLYNLNIEFFEEVKDIANKSIKVNRKNNTEEKSINVEKNKPEPDNKKSVDGGNNKPINNNNTNIKNSDISLDIEIFLSSHKSLILALVLTSIIILAIYLFGNKQEIYDDYSNYQYEYSNDEDYSDYDSYYEDYEESNYDYMISDSDSRYLSEDELRDYTKDELGYIRNEIYAKHGYVFGDDKYQGYFDQKDWYERDPSFKGEWQDFNQYEQANLKLIKSLESSVTEENEVSMPYVDSLCEQNYLNYSYPYDFVIYEADGYSFGYPKDFYNYSKKTYYGYELYADNGSTLKVSVGPRVNTDLTLNEQFENMYNEAVDKLYQPETILRKKDKERGCKRFIVNGFTDNEMTAAVYYLCNLYEDKIEIYELSTTIKGYSLEEKYHTNYILDTVYRMCSFSGTYYQPRSYEQMMDDDLGDKK